MIKIRRAKTSDVDMMTDVIFRSKQANGYDDAFMEACRDELRVTTDSLKQAEYWVAEDSSICGCVALAIDGACGEIENFFVDPDRQRQGIGRILWDQVMSQVRAANVTRLVLDADPTAVPFYEAMGFRMIGETPSGSIKGRMLPLMEMRL